MISVYMMIICFVCRPALKYNWYGTKSGSLIFLSLWTNGGWVLGVIGDPSNLLPNSRKVKSAKDLLSHCHTFYNCTFDTKALLWIRVSTPVKELKDPSLTKGS